MCLQVGTVIIMKDVGMFTEINQKSTGILPRWHRNYFYRAIRNAIKFHATEDENMHESAKGMQFTIMKNSTIANPVQSQLNYRSHVNWYSLHGDW